MNLRNLIFVLAALISTACATRQDVAVDYDQSLQLKSGENHQADVKTSNKTVVLFLVDGLSTSLLQQEIKAKKLPNLRSFFQIDPSRINQAHTIFPSLTYPSISALLCSGSVDQTGIYGNLLWDANRKIDFGSPFQYDYLNEHLRNKLVFGQLGRRNLKTVSIDYAFHAGATVVTKTADLEAGLTIMDADYEYVDKKSIDSLKLTLTETPVSSWPDFVFIHLVGVDFMSHSAGPTSERVKSYLEHLDSNLSPVFQALQHGERTGSRQIVTLLTADHGFDVPIRQYVPVEARLMKASDDMVVLNEGRFAAVFLPKAWSDAKREAYAREWAGFPSTDLVVVSKERESLVLSTRQTARLAFQNQTECGRTPYAVTVASDQFAPVSKHLELPLTCVDAIPEQPEFYYPFFLQNLAHYLLVDRHPDLILLPKPGISYLNTYRGQHGGPTPAETFVPLLGRGAMLSTSPAPATSDVLGFLSNFW